MRAFASGMLLIAIGFAFGWSSRDVVPPDHQSLDHHAKALKGSWNAFPVFPVMTKFLR